MTHVVNVVVHKDGEYGDTLEELGEALVALLEEHEFELVSGDIDGHKLT